MQSQSYEALFKTAQKEHQKQTSEQMSAFSSSSQNMNSVDEKKAIHQVMVSTMNQDSLKYDTNCVFSQLKRVTFLRFILSFGLNFFDIGQLHQKLIRFSPGLFEADLKEEKACDSYLKKFLALIYRYSNPIVNRQYIEFYLFNFEMAQVYKRICQLAKLKNLQEQCNGDASRFPHEKKFEIFLPNNTLAVKFKYWDGTQDYLLASLIIEKGFSQWEAILESRDWENYIQSEKRKSDPIKYRDYLRCILYDDCKMVPIALHQVLEERATYFLKLVK